MPPTSTDQKSHPTGLSLSRGSFAANHDGRPEPFAKLIRRTHPVRNRDILRPRQASLDLATGVPSLASEPIPPPTVILHASIIPMATTISNVPPTANIYSAHTTIPITEVALIVVGAIFAVMLGFGAIVVQARKPAFFASCLRRCCRRRKLRTLSTASGNSKGTLITTGDDYDDSTWGTPTRIIHYQSAFEATDNGQGPLEPSSLSQHENSLSNRDTLELAPSLRPTFISPPMDERPPREEAFQERLHIEEEDIATALSIALRDLLSSDNSSQPPDGANHNVETRSETEDICPLISSNEGTHSSFESIRAGLNGIGKHASIFGFKNRPRQGSDASAASQETTATHAPVYFSPDNSARSSMTSITSCGSAFDDDGEPESTYELKRAQTQSLEIKKGVLIAWQCTNLSPTDLGMPQQVIVSEPCPEPNSGPSEDTFCTLEAPFLQGGGFGTMSTLSSLVRENSRGTLSSLAGSSTSTTRAEGWCSGGEGFLQPPIPYLMVTHPSTSSIFTTESSASTLSIDLNDFPYPPSLAQPTYSQLIDQIHGQKRVWDNHPVNSTMTQKRSTVERFIMMYETT